MCWTCHRWLAQMEMNSAPPHIISSFLSSLFVRNFKGYHFMQVFKHKNKTSIYWELLCARNNYRYFFCIILFNLQSHSEVEIIRHDHHYHYSHLTHEETDAQRREHHCQGLMVSSWEHQDSTSGRPITKPELWHRRQRLPGFCQDFVWFTVVFFFN